MVLTDPPILCDVCSDPVDHDTAHSDVVVDAIGYVTGELWWHPECCPDCTADETNVIAP